MKKLLSAAALALLVTGCAGQQFRQVHTICEQTVPIAQLGRCLEFGLDGKMPNWRSDAHAAYVNAYIAWLDAAGERVIKGEMTEPQMRYGASTMLARMRQEARASSAPNMALFMAGLAIMNANQGYAPPPPTTTTFWTPGTQPISCTESLNVVTCF